MPYNQNELGFVRLPRYFNDATMFAFISQVVTAHWADSRAQITFDFSALEFIEPVGVVVLSNVIEFFRRSGVDVKFAFAETHSKAARYLDDSGFFERYLGAPLYRAPAKRSTTLPLHLICGEKVAEYLHFRLIPWVSETVKQSPESLDPLRSSVEDIFHNVVDHSGVDIGCTFAQHFPDKREMQVAVADFGVGIPEVVRRIRPELCDKDAIRTACNEGFTTKTTPHNRGAGLPNLIRFVTRANGGRVYLYSGKGKLVATSHEGSIHLAARDMSGWFPGTLVSVILKTDRLPDLAAEIEPEVFRW